MIVLKFGGTSVGRKDRLFRIVEILKNTLKSEEKAIVVVSAMSGKTKKEGTTSKLLEALDTAELGDSKKSLEILRDVENFHLNMINEIIKDKNLKEEAINFLRETIKKTGIFLEAISEIKEVTPASRDKVISIGEKLSAFIISILMKDNQIDAIYGDLSEVYPKKKYIIADKEFFYDFTNKLKEYLTPYIEKHSTVIATGFSGVIPGGIIETIGRGYSDYTAALIAAGFKAKELQIWKEVDGIFSTDPRKVKGAFVLSKISFKEAAEMAFFGAEAIHPKTMEPCIEYNIPIRIKNVDNPEYPGTLVSKEETFIVHAPKAITLKEDITIITVISNRMLDAPGFIAKIGEIYNNHHISIDLIATSEVSVSCSIHNISTEKIELVKRDLEKIGEVHVMKNLSSISVIGHGMQMTPGIAGKVFSTLGRHRVNIVLISQGASELSISFVVDKKDGLKALQVLHDMIVEERKKALTSS